MIAESLKAEIARMANAIEWAQAGLKHAPEGRLLVDTSGSKPQYYWRRNSKERKGVYLGKAHAEKIRA